MNKLYFISGLGADSRAFTKIQEFDNYQNVFIEWIPNLPNEAFSNYIARLIKGYDIKANDIIIGLSFGGLAAIEIARQTSAEKVILLSSFQDKNGLKPHLKFLLDLRLYNLIPNFKLKFFDKQAVKGFGDVSEEAKQGLIEMMRDTNPKFIKWSLKQIRKSKFKMIPNTEIFNIIGTKDELVQNWELTSNNFHINNGSHLMVYDNADEINTTLKKILQVVNS
ncbi:MAG: alpha/beta hydrolase [Vicingaceae bacterium]|nr:alpha/beta hydrolase [Vicingaceae bacterium]